MRPEEVARHFACAKGRRRRCRQGRVGAPVGTHWCACAAWALRGRCVCACAGAACGLCARAAGACKPHAVGAVGARRADSLPRSPRERPRVTEWGASAMRQALPARPRHACCAACAHASPYARSLLWLERKGACVLSCIRSRHHKRTVQCATRNRYGPPRTLAARTFAPFRVWTRRGSCERPRNGTERKEAPRSQGAAFPLLIRAGLAAGGCSGKQWLYRELPL